MKRISRKLIDLQISQQWPHQWEIAEEQLPWWKQYIRISAVFTALFYLPALISFKSIRGAL